MKTTTVTRHRCTKCGAWQRVTTVTKAKGVTVSAVKQVLEAIGVAAPLVLKAIKALGKL